MKQTTYCVAVTAVLACGAFIPDTTRQEIEASPPPTSQPVSTTTTTTTTIATAGVVDASPAPAVVTEGGGGSVVVALTPPPAPPVEHRPTIRERITARMPWTFTLIAPCESTGDLDSSETWLPITGPAGERGLFQIHPIHRGVGGAIARAGRTWEEMYDVEANIDVALVLYADRGLLPWTPSRHCWGGR